MYPPPLPIPSSSIQHKSTHQISPGLYLVITISHIHPRFHNIAMKEKQCANSRMSALIAEALIPYTSKYEFDLGTHPRFDLDNQFTYISTIHLHFYMFKRADVTPYHTAHRWHLDIHTHLSAYTNTHFSWLLLKWSGDKLKIYKSRVRRLPADTPYRHGCQVPTFDYNIQLMQHCIHSHRHFLHTCALDLPTVGKSVWSHLQNSWVRT